MVNKKFCLIVIFLLLLGFSTGGIKLNTDTLEMVNLSGEIKGSIQSIQAYTPRTPTFITNNVDLNNSFPGIGTIDDPIQIAGYNITSSSSPLIYIQDTTFYFEISGNYLNGNSNALRGIYLYNVENGNIENNIITSCGQGIEFRYSHVISIVNNTITRSNYNGIKLNYNSDDNYIINNTIYYSFQESGILIDSCINTTISNNIVYANDDGIRLLSSSDVNRVINNTVYNNEDYGISIEGPTPSNNNIITNNTVHSNHQGGIGVFQGSSHNVIFNNTISDSVNYGIYNNNSDTNILLNNTVKNCGYGINIIDSRDNLVENNSLMNSGFYIGGSNVESYLQSSMLHNSVNGKPLIYWISKNGGTVPSNAGQIILFNCTDITITNQIISNTSLGIVTAYCSGLMIHNNTFNYCTHGIFLDQQTNISTITKNTFYNNIEDIYLFNASNNYVSNNTMGNGGISIFLISADGNTFSHNLIFNADYWGISFWRSSNNTITHNKIYETQWYGIAFDQNSSNNIVMFNDFSSNDEDGSQVVDNGVNNVFDYNYWSDWISPDTNVDDIVDEPYSIEGASSNQDNHPLVVSPTINSVLKTIVTSPIGGETFSGDVSISWNLLPDPWVYTVTFSVYYSIDEGSSWNLIVDGLTGTSLTWDSTTVPDGDSYTIKVEAVTVGGLEVYSTTANSFIIDNVPPTTTTTTTTTTATITPSWSVFLLVLCLLILVPDNKKKK